MTATKPTPFEFDKKVKQAITDELERRGASKEAAAIFIASVEEDIRCYLSFEREKNRRCRESKRATN